jgi:chemotaxis family two-component system response regulator Rcp1
MPKKLAFFSQPGELTCSSPSPAVRGLKITNLARSILFSFGSLGPDDYGSAEEMKEDPIGDSAMEILLVDDNPGDVRIVMEGLKDALPDARLSVVTDGVEAVRFLRREGEYAKAPRPDMILLDLRLPKKSGFDVLAEIKQDPTLASIPIVVQTSSASTTDVDRAYSLHANCYITKPVDLDQLTRTMRALAEFWVKVAKLPGWRN